MRYLISDLGADATQADDQGHTPLFIAAQCGQLAVVRYLAKELGADVNQSDQEGWTPLPIAAQNGHLAVVRCLVLECGADVNLGNQFGATPLYIAAQEGHVAIVRCLVKELGADVKKANSRGTTPLYIATEMGHLAVVRCLVEELGADFNLAKKGGSTALMMLARKCNHKIVAYLMRHGADPQATIPTFGTAANSSKVEGASAEQTTYLEAKTNCSNRGCAGPGLKKCTGCKQVRYCGQQCQLAHWPMHKADCKAAAELRVAKDK
jgi:ankyrin repeat protein